MEFQCIVRSHIFFSFLLFSLSVGMRSIKPFDCELKDQLEVSSVFSLCFVGVSNVQCIHCFFSMTVSTLTVI